MNIDNKIALYSLLSKGIKIVSGPIVILVVSTNLSESELAFYYTFFSLIAMQQLLEVGIGHVLRQQISHAFVTNDNVWSMESRRNIKSISRFSHVWFFAIAIAFFIIVGGIGYYYFSTFYQGDIEWKGPWLLLVITSAIYIYLAPINIIIESIQRQVVLFQSRALGAVCNAILITLLLVNDFKLYSIGLSLLLSNAILYTYLWKQNGDVISELKSVSANKSVREVFDSIKSLLCKVSLVWLFGYLFWNGFNLISFSSMNIEDAGKFMFLMSLAKVGFQISESITQGQMTLYSNMISQGKVKQAKSLFSKYRTYSFYILFSGYSVFLTFVCVFEKSDVVRKLPDKHSIISVLIYFSLLLVLTLRNNFIRCFKVEPFVKISVFNAIFVPFSFWFTLKNSIGNPMLLSSLIIIISIMWSIKIERNLRVSE
ncbi:hypothetical protein AB4376_04110 [Vibrio breoganii]